MPTMELGAPARVQRYREHARTLRRLARETRISGAQARLRAMADSFDRLADHAEAREHVDVELARARQRPPNLLVRLPRSCPFGCG
jgi:hypothetical protein